MPVIDFQSPLESPPVGLFTAIDEEISKALGLPEDRVWILWHCIPNDCYFRKNWSECKYKPAPIVRVRCKSVYSDEQRRSIIAILARLTAEYCEVDINGIYVVVDTVQKGLVFVRGELWI